MTLAVGHWTVDDYDRAVERGTFGPDPRIELVRGEIYEVSPIGPRHANMVRRLNAALRDVTGFEIGVQDPVVIGDHSEPQPDMWIARPGDYNDHHPSAEDLALVVEVSDTTLYYDRFVKAPTYIAAGVSEVWVVDLAAAVVWVYADRDEIGSMHEGLVVNRETGFAVRGEDLFA